MYREVAEFQLIHNLVTLQQTKAFRRPTDSIIDHLYVKNILKEGKTR